MPLDTTADRLPTPAGWVVAPPFADRVGWLSQPQTPVRIAEQFQQYVDFAQCLSVPPEISGFTKSGTIDRTVSHSGIGYVGDRSTGHYYRSLVGTLTPPYWMMAVIIPTTLDTTSNNVYAIGENTNTFPAQVTIKHNNISTQVLCYTTRAVNSGLFSTSNHPDAPEIGKTYAMVGRTWGTAAADTLLWCNGVKGSLPNNAQSGSGATFAYETISGLRKTTLNGPANDIVLMVARGFKFLPDAVAYEVSRNPWQLFASDY